MAENVPRARATRGTGTQSESAPGEPAPTVKKAPVKKAPVKKAPVKKAPVKKAPVKKAPVKKAPVKKTPTTNRSAPTKAGATKAAPTGAGAMKAAPTGAGAMKAPATAIATTVGGAGQTDIGPSVVPTPAADMAPATSQPPSVRPTVVERVVALDWAVAARVALPSLLVLLAAAGVASSYLLMIDQGSDDVPLAGSPDPTVGRFLQALVGLAAMALGSPLTIESTNEMLSVSFVFRAVPLTVTILVLAVYAGLARRYLPAADEERRSWARVGLTALLFAVLASALSFAARSSSSSGGSDVEQHASPGHVFGWSLLLTALVGSAVVATPRLQARLAEGRIGAWELPVRGALVALTTAVVLGGIAGIISLFVSHDRADVELLDLARVSPAIAGYFVSIGVFVAAMAMGASVRADAGGFAEGDTSLGYANLHGLPPLYLLLLLLPVVAVTAGLAWMVRHRGENDGRELARACYRMALPFAVGWFVLVVAAGAQFGAGTLGAATVGPDRLVSTALALGWALLIGLAVGQLILRRGTSGPLPVPERRPVRLPSWRGTTLAAGIVVLAVVVAAVARGGGSAAASSDHAPFTQPDAAAVPTFAPDADSTVVEVNMRMALTSLAAVQESFHDRHGRYARDLDELDYLLVHPDVSLQIVRADERMFCLEARGEDTAGVFSLRSDRELVEAEVC